MNRGKFYGLIGLMIIFSVVVIFTSNLNPFGSVEEVNGNSTEAVTYYLGDSIYSENANIFYFHGNRLATQGFRVLLIGHRENISGSMSNMEFWFSVGEQDQFRLMDQSFKIIDSSRSWITLEEIQNE